MKVYWLQQCEAAVPPGDAWLGGMELAIQSRLRVPKRRADWRLGRWTAKLAMALRQGISRDPQSLNAIQVIAAPGGAPEVITNNGCTPPAISLSHSGGVAICALGSRGAELGCDIETVSARSSAFLEDFFGREEQDLVARAPQDDRNLLITLMWSAKESTLKALRCGLRSDTRCVCTIEAGILKTAEDHWQPLATRHESGQVFRGWWSRPGGFVRTVVSDSELELSLLEET